MKKILHIVGNRPQFVKLAVLYKELESAAGFTQSIIHTGQHFSYEMNELFFKELNIPEPVVNFNLQHVSPNQFIGMAADALQDYFSKETNAIVFVYGDTNSTLAAAIAAKRVGLPLVHFEAGVRTMDNSMPEEINRILTDRLADINYCCTQQNLDNLIAEGYGTAIQSKAFLTGDLMLDAFIQIQPGTLQQTIPPAYILCTIHRAANLQSKEKLTQIIHGLNELHQTIPVVMPVHPHTQKKIATYELSAQFIMLPAVGYREMKKLMESCSYVITDSGGTSREAYFMKKKSLIVMDKPFWPEIIEAGCALQTATSCQEMLEQAAKLHTITPNFNAAIFGNGNAAVHIRTHLEAVYGPGLTV